MDISETLDEDERQEQQAYLGIICRLFKMQDVCYWIGNPSVEITSGEIFLKPTQFPPQQQCSDPTSLVKALKQLNKIDGQCLLLLGIPNCKSPVEVCEALGDDLSMIRESRVVKSSQGGLYAFLLLLESEEKARSLYDRHFGKKYNEIEKELILFRQIQSMTLSFDQFKISENDPVQIRKKSTFDESQKVLPQNIFMSYNLSKTQDKVNFTCAICFDAMLGCNKQCPSSPTKNQSSDHDNCRKGIVSILCGHFFHWDCLARWTERTCPLCRYHQQPPKLSFCQNCNISQGLWLCLICGKKQCSGLSYDITSLQSHIMSHFRESGHALVMDIETKFVYDFTTKDFIHRVFEVQGTRQLQGNMKKPKKKDYEQVVKQYNSMMKEQLQSQRQFYTEQLSTLRQKNQISLRKLKQSQENVERQLNQIDIDLKSYDFAQDDEEIRQLQIEMSAAERYNKLLVQRAKSISKMQEEDKNKLKQEEQQLDQRIMELRQEAKDIQKNIDLHQQLHKKMKGERIAKQFFINKKR